MNLDMLDKFSPFLKRTPVSDLSGAILADLFNDFIEVNASDVSTLDGILEQTSARNAADLIREPAMMKFALTKIAKAKLSPKTAGTASTVQDDDGVFMVCRFCGGVNEFRAGDQLEQ